MSDKYWTLPEAAAAWGVSLDHARKIAGRIEGSKKVLSASGGNVEWRIPRDAPIPTADNRRRKPK